jgi:hypothetical protein
MKSEAHMGLHHQSCGDPSLVTFSFLSAHDGRSIKNKPKETAVYQRTVAAELYVAAWQTKKSVT